MYVGIDIGGTKTLVLASEDPKSFSEPIRQETAQEVAEGLDQFESMIREALAGKAPSGIGVSIGGPMNWAAGLCSFLHLEKWSDVPLKGELERRFSCPVRIENDTDAAVIAEAKLGGATASRLLYVTVSTGIGAGFFVDGDIYRGEGDFHPEFGHQEVPRTDRFKDTQCPCGARNCLEALVSGRSIERHFEKPAAGLTEEEWREVATVMAAGLRNAILLYAPGHIALGGGVCVKAPGVYLSTIKEILEREVKLVPCPEVSISALGYETSLRGALLLASET